jgi:hypothetical protein
MPHKLKMLQKLASTGLAEEFRGFSTSGGLGGLMSSQERIALPYVLGTIS